MEHLYIKLNLAECQEELNIDRGETMSFVLARKKAGFSQREVAEKLDVSDAAVCMWETGKTLPRSVLLPKIAELYQCTIDDLLKDNPAE